MIRDCVLSAVVIVRVPMSIVDRVRIDGVTMTIS